MQGEKKFEITQSHQLTSFFTTDEDYLDAIKVVSNPGSSSDQTRLTNAQKYLQENDLFANHPDIHGLHNLCSNFLGFDFNLENLKRIDEHFRNIKYIQALKGEQKLIDELFENNESQNTIAALFDLKDNGINIVFFAVLSGNLAFVQEMITRVQSSQLLKTKFNFNAHYTQHKLNSLFCAVMLRSPTLFGYFLDEKVDINHKITNKGESYSLLQIMVYFYKNTELLKILKAKLPDTYSKFINNITLEPINSDKTPQDLLSYAINTKSIQGERTLLDLVDFCLSDIKVSETLLQIVESKLQGETKTTIQGKLKAKNASSVHNKPADDGEVETGVLDEEAHIVGEEGDDQAEEEAADGTAAKDTDPKEPSRVILAEEEEVEEEGEEPLTNPADSKPKDPSRVVLLDEEEEEVEEPLTNPADSKPKDPSRVVLEEEEEEAEEPLANPADSKPKDPSRLILAEEEGDEEVAVAAPVNDGPLVLEDDDEEEIQVAPADNDGKNKEPSRVILTDEEEEEEEGVEERHEDLDEVDDAPIMMGFAGPKQDAQRLLGQQGLNLDLFFAEAQVANLARDPAFNQLAFPGVDARPPAPLEALDHGGEEQPDHRPLTRADQLRQALLFDTALPQRQSFVRSPKKLSAVKKAPSIKQYDDVLQENSLQWKLMEACVALCDKSVRSEIEKRNPKPSETDPNKKNELKLNYARHFNFIVEKNPKRAQELLKRLKQIRREKPKPNFSTADYIYIIAGDPNGFAYQNNLTFFKSNVAKIDGGETESVIKLQVQTDDKRSAIFYAQKESYQEGQTLCQFNAIIPLSYHLTEKDFLLKTSRDQSGRTALHWAAISGSFAMLQTLEKGYEHLRMHSKIPANSLPQYSSVDARNNTVAHEIARSGLYQIAVDNNTTHNITVELQQFEFQHEASVKITSLRNENLLLLIKNPHISFFSTRNIQGDLPIHLVVSNNQRDLLEILLHDPNALITNLDADLYGTNGTATNVSILHYAAMCPEVHWKTVQLIIEEKPKLLNAQDSKGFKPLDWAAAACNVPTQLLLLAKGATLATKSYTGDSPLSIALTTYTFDDEEIGASSGLPLHMSTRIPGFNTITQRRFLQVPTYPTDDHSRYITPEELKHLDEILKDVSIMKAFTQLHDRLKLASWSALEKKLEQKNGTSNSATPLSYPDKLATRLREYALLPIAVLQFKGVEFGAREKAASSENTRGLQVIRTAQFYSSFFTRKEFPISSTQRKNFLIDIGRGNSNTALEDLILPLSEIIEGFNVLLRQTICLYDDLWVMEDVQENGDTTKKCSLDEYGQRIPSWGQWWVGETPYKQITINILDKAEELLSKVEQVNSQLEGHSIDIGIANEQLSGYKKELIELIDTALRKADKKMLHVDHDTSDPATSDFRLRCMVAKVLAEKAVLTKADTPDTKPLF